jgi:2-methylisocitrate lyase-like PEP mutase family enzyme
MENIAMTEDLAAKAARFRALHEAEGCFVMPNAWDIGSARLLATAGFGALATTSAGVNYAQGRPDGPQAASRETILAAYGEIARAVDLPVSGDLENGYGDSPEDVEATIRLAVAEGLAGGGIEDWTGRRDAPYYDIELAAERIAAAREAADASGTGFVLTARAECFLYGHATPLEEAIKRLNRYREAGADCLYAPGPTDDETLRRLAHEVDGPLNVVVGMGGDAARDHMARLGVKRISTGGSLYRATCKLVLDAAREMAEAGTFGYLGNIIADGEIQRLVTG